MRIHVQLLVHATTPSRDLVGFDLSEVLDCLKDDLLHQLRK